MTIWAILLNFFIFQTFINQILRQFENKFAIKYINNIQYSSFLHRKWNLFSMFGKFAKTSGGGGGCLLNWISVNFTSHLSSVRLRPRPACGANGPDQCKSSSCHAPNSCHQGFACSSGPCLKKIVKTCPVYAVFYLLSVIHRSQVLNIFQDTGHITCMASFSQHL